MVALTATVKNIFISNSSGSWVEGDFRRVYVSNQVCVPCSSAGVFFKQVSLPQFLLWQNRVVRHSSELNFGSCNAALFERALSSLPSCITLLGFFTPLQERNQTSRHFLFISVWVFLIAELTFPYAVSNTGKGNGRMASRSIFQPPSPGLFLLLTSSPHNSTILPLCPGAVTG